jgi:hypothetical protein
VLLPPNLTVQAPVPESLEAAQNGHQRPQLTSPARPSPDGAPGQVAPRVAPPPSPPEDTGDGQPGDHLPIFEAARSDWFDEEDIHRDHLPLRRHGAEQPGTAPEEERWDGGDTQPAPPPASPADPVQHPPPTSPAPPTAARYPRAEQPSTLASSPPPMPATPLTSSGLPRRVPRANLAPGILATQAEQEPPPVSPAPPTAPDIPPTAPDIPPAAPARSPEAVRSMLSSYRSGVERGRTRAGGPDPDAPRSSRSDDDPTQ